MRLLFYDVDKDYIKYLKLYDRQVCDIDYNSKNSKFVVGIVFEINDFNYYAPISHFTTQQRTNILIQKQNGDIISSIRFSFMIPVYPEAIIQKDFSQETDYFYKRLIIDEYNFCKKNIDRIKKRAKEVYAIGTNKSHPLNYTCCDFKILEQKMLEYISLQEVAATTEN